MVGDGHAMGVAAQILQHIFWAAEGTFQVDDPVLSVEWSQPGSEDLGLSKECQVSVEVELTVTEGLFESGDELATKDPTQHLFGKEVIISGANPVGVIERKAAGGNDAMDVGMNVELLTPSVQHTEEADLCTEVSRTAARDRWIATRRRAPVDATDGKMNLSEN